MLTFAALSWDSWPTSLLPLKCLYSVCTLLYLHWSAQMASSFSKEKPSPKVSCKRTGGNVSMTAAHSFGSVATCFLPTTSEGLLGKVKTSTPCSAWNILEPQPTLLSSVHEFTLTALVSGLDCWSFGGRGTCSIALGRAGSFTSSLEVVYQLCLRLLRRGIGTRTCNKLKLPKVLLRQWNNEASISKQNSRPTNCRFARQKLSKGLPPAFAYLHVVQFLLTCSQPESHEEILMNPATIVT